MAQNGDVADESHTTCESSDFAEQLLHAHNVYRRQHNAPDLTLNEELCEQAQRWTEKLAARHHMAYCELAGVGENITFFPANMSPSAIVEYWYNENRKYEYETPGWQPGTNYFTQIVWRATKEIGVGRKVVSSAEYENTLKPATKPPSAEHQTNGGLRPRPDEPKQIVVAFYRPAGNNNRAGQFAMNVLKPVGSNQ
uniref:SCP domain-containing protein n=1 Tax=Panagrellus redivivus TaxID=6233 RepID=A0A7E4VPY2_PANRE